MSDISMEQFMADHEVLYSMASSALLWFLGDVLAQLVECYLVKTAPVLPSSPSSAPSSAAASSFLSSYQPLRSLRLAFFSAFVWAPATFYWFRLLESSFPGEGLSVALQRMVADQLLYAPLVILALFVVVGLLEGKGVPAIWRKVQDSYLSTLTRNWMLWPAVQLLLQGFVPLQSRIFLANCVNLPWTAFLAYQAAQGSAGAGHRTKAASTSEGGGKKKRTPDTTSGEGEDELEPMAVR